MTNKMVNLAFRLRELEQLLRDFDGRRFGIGMTPGGDTVYHRYSNGIPTLAIPRSEHPLRVAIIDEIRFVEKEISDMLEKING